MLGHLADTRHDLELRFSHEEEPFWLKYAIGHERFHGSVTNTMPAYWLHSFLPKSCWVGSVIWSSSTLRLGHNTPLSGEQKREPKVTEGEPSLQPPPLCALQ